MKLPRRAILAAIAVGVVLRGLPLGLWYVDLCVRDECTYRRMAEGIVAGQGLTTESGWLWAPGYPALLAASLAMFDMTHPLRYAQVALAGVGIWLVDHLARRVLADDPAAGLRAGAIAAWAYALHPTLVFFAGTMWSEAVYGPLLLGAFAAWDWAREGGWRRAVLPGLLVAGCVLFRGVAQYMAPLFALGFVWPNAGEALRDALRARWRHALAFGFAVALGVMPYSVHATRTYGGFVLADATLGQMMWYGNNDFPPIAFDWGSGLLSDASFESWTRHGRAHCDVKLPPAQWNACEVAAGRAWIAAHPVEFVRRVPLRVAQLLNPHTFLVRHLRSGRWPGVPFELKEGLIGLTLLWSYVVVLGGTVAAAARARGAYGVLVVTVVAYHVAAVAVTAGLTRYRIPLEPLWLVFLAVAVAQPGATARALAGPRGIAAAALVGVLAPLALWFLRAGLPGFDGH